MTLDCPSFYNMHMNNFEEILLKNGYSNLQAGHMRKCFYALDNVIDGIFPDADFIKRNLIDLRCSDKQVKNSLNPFYMPFHTRDADWMASFIDNATYKQLKEKGNSVSFAAIKAYVQCAKEYHTRCSIYERNIVKSYIELLKGSETDAFMISKDSKEKFLKQPDYDIRFYQKVANAMRALEMPEASIERGLELNADLWREDAKKIAFENSYVPKNKNKIEQNKNLLKKHAPEKFSQVLRTKHDLYELWSILRDYQYYLNHKDVIERTKTKTPSMCLTQEEAKRIKELVDMLSVEYEFALIEAAAEIDEILSNIQKQKQTERADKANRIDYAEENFDQQNTSYWDTHQPVVNYDSKIHKGCLELKPNHRYDANGNLGKPQTPNFVGQKKRKVIIVRKKIKTQPDDNQEQKPNGDGGKEI